MKADNKETEKLLNELEKVLAGVAKVAGKDQKFFEKVKATFDSTLGNLYKKPGINATKDNTSSSPRPGK